MKYVDPIIFLDVRIYTCLQLSTIGGISLFHFCPDFATGDGSTKRLPVFVLTSLSTTSHARSWSIFGPSALPLPSSGGSHSKSLLCQDAIRSERNCDGFFREPQHRITLGQVLLLVTSMMKVSNT
eukprot:5883794-Amphidinium_carterae.1